MSSPRCVGILVVFLLVAVPLSAQPAPEASGQASSQPRRPRIGLALGGGSARGMAHIGVLRWFEEHHIPIDVIAGTSMGGLIGGAYASGMTPDEIRALMNDTDWDLMFLADSPYKYKTFRRKQDKRMFPSLLEFGLKGGLSLPGGLNPGQQVTLLLDRIALPYYDLKSFDDLPTPYRCVATDIRGGDAVVLERPPLARAMRATMAIPGVFTPVNWDDWLLVDGGALNNIPADVVRDMGADIVIAVNVGADSEQESQAQTLFAMMGRTLDTMMTTNSRRALESADMVVDPDLTGFSSGSWRDSDGLSERGYAGTEQLSGRLMAYAMTPEEHAAFMAARQAKRRHTVPSPSYVSVEGIGVTLPEATRRDIRTALQPLLNEPIDPETISSSILEVTGTDRYEYLTYGMTDTPQPTGLDIGVRPKTYGPPFLMLGLDLSNVDSTNFAFNLSSRVLHYGLLGRGSEARLDFVLGTEQRAALELLKPLFGSPVFVAGRGFFDRRGLNLYVDDDFVAEYRVKRSGAGIDLGTDFGRSAELRVGVNAADVRGRRRVGSPFLPEAEGTERWVGVGFIFDSQTSPLVPTRGIRLRSWLRRYYSGIKATGEFAGVGGDDYTVGLLGTSWFKTIRTADRLFVLGEGGFTAGEEPLLNQFSVGGPLTLGAFNNNEVSGDNYLLGIGGYLRNLGRMPDVLGGHIFGGAWIETGSAYDRWDEVDWNTNATVGLLVETLFGPLFAGGSVPLDGGGLRLYISLGPFFR